MALAGLEPALPFAVVAVGLIYTAADLREGLLQLWGWRRLLFLPIACVLFNEPQWKTAFLRVFAASTALVALLVLLLSVQQTVAQGASSLVPVTLVRNYVVQGMTFTVGLVACALLIPNETGRLRKAWIACAVVLALAATLVTQGRSGYLVLLVVSGTFVCASLIQRGVPLLKAVPAGMAVLAVALALLAAAVTLALYTMRPSARPRRPRYALCSP